MQLEVFFDYACPYCMRAHEYLAELVLYYPKLELLWRPCEAHPRPDSYGPHSDLMIMGLFFAQDVGADIWKYHGRMYRAALLEHKDVERIDVLGELIEDMMSRSEFEYALAAGSYAPQLKAANAYAYEKSGVWAVPSYRMGNLKFDSKENIGITREQLKQLIENGLGHA